MSESQEVEEALPKAAITEGVNRDGNLGESPGNPSRFNAWILGTFIPQNLMKPLSTEETDAFNLKCGS